MFGFIAGVVTVAAGIFGFAFARDYTIRRLRYVDGVRNPIWPWVVGLIGAVVAMPVVWVLHFVGLIGGGAALVFGVTTGLGTASGVKALKRGGS